MIATAPPRLLSINRIPADCALPPAVEPVNPLHVLARELEVEQRRVREDAFGARGFREGGEPRWAVRACEH